MPDNDLYAKAARYVRNVMRHRERYIHAWVAATGLHPTECEIVEEMHPMDASGVVRTVVWVRKREAAGGG